MCWKTCMHPWAPSCKGITQCTQRLRGPHLKHLEARGTAHSALRAHALPNFRSPSSPAVHNMTSPTLHSFLFLLLCLRGGEYRALEKESKLLKHCPQPVQDLIESCELREGAA